MLAGVVEGARDQRHPALALAGGRQRVLQVVQRIERVAQLQPRDAQQRARFHEPVVQVQGVAQFDLGGAVLPLGDVAARQLHQARRFGLGTRVGCRGAGGVACALCSGAATGPAMSRASRSAAQRVMAASLAVCEKANSRRA
jgi:hypothetical protein